MTTYLEQNPNELSRINNEKKYFTSDDDNIDGRCEYAKDRDRIVFSKAFRRLGRKTQAYTNSKGDHYRTRLSHTLEVAQIAQSIAKRLSLNVELSAAIAYGHDIGHTPFGHEGERALNDIMIGKDSLGGVIIQRFNHGGFKHNFNGLRMLNRIEEKYPKSAGMNLTWETMEGILKHTKFKNSNSFICRIDEYLDNYTQFFVDGNINILNFDNSVTLEGQIVAIADEIAQRQHDLDDGFMDSSLNIDMYSFISNLLSELDGLNCNTDDDEHKMICHNMICDLRRIQTDIKENTVGTDLARDLIVRWVLNYLIYDVSLHSKKSLAQDNLETFTFKDKKCFSKKYIEFSAFGEKVNEYFADYISSEIVNSYEINSQDGKAVFLIRRLFKAFHSNPRQMPKHVMENIYMKVRRISNESGNETFISQYVKCEDFHSIKKKDLDKLISILRLDAQSFQSGYSTDARDESFPAEILEFIEKNKGKIVYPSNNMGNDKLIYLLNHHYIFEICDFISGMTDNYCASEYKKLFQVD